MGEIKSTLDLVMERTRHLSLSEEEKSQQKKTDFEKRLQGLLQQYADGSMDVDTLCKRISKLQSELSIDDRQIVNDAIFERITLDENNQPWLALLNIYAPCANEPVRQILNAYNNRQLELVQTGEIRQREKLARQYGITGTAVVPNPQKEPNYLQDLSALKQQVQTKIEAVAKQ